KYASYIQKGYVNMERHKFDLWLKGLIPSHIHSFHRAYFKSIQKEGAFYQVHFKQEQDSLESSTQSYTCKVRIVVGADGAKSHIRRFLYPHLKTQSLVCIQQWYKEHNKPMLSCIFDKTLTPSYSWSMSKDGYFIFGGAYPHAHCKAAFNTQKVRLEGLGFIFTEVLKQEACLVLQPQRWRDFVRGRNGVFLIGEAAGFINASTLEGISGALHSSRILSEVLNSIVSYNQGESGVKLDSKTLENLHSVYTKRTRLLVLKTLFRHYVRYPFMFITILRRIILFCGILRVRSGMIRNKII
ncbi:FAD-binding protein, partial [Helicobacter typhlonius]